MLSTMAHGAFGSRCDGHEDSIGCGKVATGLLPTSISTHQTTPRGASSVHPAFGPTRSNEGPSVAFERALLAARETAELRKFVAGLHATREKSSGKSSAHGFTGVASIIDTESARPDCLVSQTVQKRPFPFHSTNGRPDMSGIIASASPAPCTGSIPKVAKSMSGFGGTTRLVTLPRKPVCTIIERDVMGDAQAPGHMHSVASVLKRPEIPTCRFQRHPENPQFSSKITDGTPLVRNEYFNRNVERTNVQRFNIHVRIYEI